MPLQAFKGESLMAGTCGKICPPGRCLSYSRRVWGIHACHPALGYREDGMWGHPSSESHPCVKRPFQEKLLAVKGS